MKNQENEIEDRWSQAIQLEGRKLRLEPLAEKHLDDLTRNLLREHSWHGLHWGLRTRQDLETVIRRSQAVRQEKAGNGFAMVLKNTSEAVGVSHFMAFSRKHNGVEIGGTWVGQDFQKSFVNTEAKALMLGHAFEFMGCQRVEFRADSLNFNSQRAILRLGAKFEGELRRTGLLPDGRKRDYKVYSIIDSEWPNLKAALNGYLDRYV
jgi:RimJ/RimL family protein N-acetyltransferase